jgi:hypothetical protein
MSCAKSHKMIPDHVFHALSIVKLLYFDSRLCCEWKRLKSIPYYVFQAMSYLKKLKIDFKLCIPCYVDGEISSFLIINLFMSLTGLSLEMYIFHFEAIAFSTHISGSKRPNFTNLVSLERPWPVACGPKMGLWSAPD